MAMGNQAQVNQKSLTFQQLGWTEALFSVLTQILELLELRYLVWSILLDPTTAWSAFLTKFNMVKFDPSKDVPDLTGKVILVTGGNTGLGYEAIKALAPHKPAHIYLAARTASKANAAIESLRSVSPDTSITHIPLDLTSFASIRAAADNFRSQSQRLDVLMLNAGIMAVPPGHTEDGFEIQLGTNHFGHFLLTKLLLPTLQATSRLEDSDVRIVTMTSEGHKMARTGKILFSQTELEKCGAWVRYAYSKLANVLFAREFARRYPEITTVAVHPGVVSTDLFNSTQKNNLFMRVGLAIMGNLRSTPEQGAWNQLWASTAPKAEIVNGAYYNPVGVVAKPSPCGQDAKLAEQFWDWSENQLKEKGIQ